MTHSTRFLERLSRHATERPDVPAFVDSASGLALTWKSLATQVTELADRLRRSFRPDSVVLIRCPNGIDFPVAFLSVLAAECAAFPLSVDSPEMEIETLGKRVKADALLTCGGVAGAATGSHIDLRILATSNRDTAPDVSARTRLMLLSSGSTGDPKIVCRSDNSLDAVCDQMCQSIKIGPDDRILATVPLCHSYGIEHGLLAPVWAGATVYLCRGLDLPLIKRELTHCRITHLPGVPSMYEMLANHAERGEQYTELRAAYSAGAPLPLGVFEAVSNRCGIKVGQLYGASEIGSVTYADPTLPNFDPSSVGRAMPGAQVRVTAGTDPKLSLAAGEVGHVWVSAASQFSGYFDEHASPFADGFYPTGDLGRLDSSGNLFVTGRVKLLIDVGGLKVNPLEVENVLMQHPSVGDCVVLPVRQSATIHRLKAVITARDLYNPPHIEELRQFARDRLATYKVPRVFEIRDSLPRSATGKLIRHLVEA